MSAALIADSFDEYDQLDAYKALRNARKRNRITKVDLFDAFYKAYVLGIGAFVAIYGGTEALGEQKLNLHHLDVVQRQGAGYIGLFVALAIAIGLRSGGRGGPMAFERADVRHLLMAPIDKRATIRTPALRQLRHTLVLALGVGAAAGIIVSHRMPHSVWLWVASGALFGAVTATLGFGIALLAGGLQVKRWFTDLLALLVLGWSGADAALKMKTSPMSWVGTSVLWPLKFNWLGIAVIPLALIVAAAGLSVINRMSMEAAERRSRLIGQLRFAATLQDVRTVMVIQRQLSQEHTRMKPWFRMRPTRRVGIRRNRVVASVFVRRGMAGLLRWPVTRFLRLMVFVAIAAASAVGIWGGSAILVLVGGLALWLAGLDLVEGLAQEMDHPDRVESMPRKAGHIYVQQLILPFFVLFILEFIAYLVIAAFGRHDIVGAFGIDVVVSAVCAIGGASVAVTQKPSVATGSVETPEIAGFKFILRILIPPAIAIAGLVPIVAGQRGWAHTHTLSGISQQVSAAMTAVLVIAILPIAWLGYKDEFKAAMAAPTKDPKAAAEDKNPTLKDKPKQSPNKSKPSQNKKKRK